MSNYKAIQQDALGNRKVQLSKHRKEITQLLSSGGNPM